MAITIYWPTKVINVPQADLTLLSGSLYELNLNTFRLALKDLEDDDAGRVFERTHKHNTEVTVSGFTLGRVVEIINGYTVTFEDGQYAVNLVGANSNVADVTNVNQVSVRPFNAAGLITVTTGSGVTEQDKLDIAQDVWERSEAADLIARHPAALVGGRMDASMGAVAGASAGVPNLSTSLGLMKSGTIDDTAFAPTLTEFECSDITDSTANLYLGRIVYIVSGPAQYAPAEITAYTLAGGRGHFTVSPALPATPGNGDLILITA